MGYLGGYQGDYLGGYRGDPGLFGFIGKAAKKIGGSLLDLNPITRVGRRVVGAALGGGRGSRRVVPPQQFGGPAGMTGTIAQRVKADEMLARAEGWRPRYRRMNVGNAKALRRAIRRQQGFVKLARRALKGTGYRIVTSGSRARPRVSVRESGPGSVTVR